MKNEVEKTCMECSFCLYENGEKAWHTCDSFISGVISNDIGETETVFWCGNKWNHYNKQLDLQIKDIKRASNYLISLLKFHLNSERKSFFYTLKIIDYCINNIVFFLEKQKKG